MKLTRFTALLVSGLILTLAATGCKHKAGYITPLPGHGANAGQTGNPDIGGGSQISGTGLGETGLGSTNTAGGVASTDPNKRIGWAEDANQFKANTVHFRFDSSEVQSSDASNVSAVADYLKNNAANAVKVEGHCDERGTAEYNRALGERRALAVREELVKQGVDAGRVDTISYGFDKPVDAGHTDTAWAKNRRAEFILLTPPAGKKAQFSFNITRPAESSSRGACRL
jgi:peptidoglycan-associated lipoprotein